MVRITLAELQDRFDHYRDLARAEPVSLTENGQEDLVILSADEYQRLKRQLDDRAAVYSWELSDQELNFLDAAEIPEEASQFDHEYKRKASA